MSSSSPSMTTTRSARRRRARLTVAVTVLATVALVAAACGGDDGDGGAADGEAGDLAALCPYDALDDAEGVVEIDLWHGEVGLPNQTLEKIAQRYNESQDRVEVTPQYQGTYEEQLRKYTDAMADPGSLPDLVSPDDTVTQFMADSGTVIPAQACIEADPDAAAIYDDMVPIVPAAYSIDDVLWPAAYSASGAALYANEEHFRAAGLDPAELPGTLEELRATAETIAAAGIPGLDAPLVMRIESWPLEFLTTGAEQAVVNEDNGRAALGTESTYDNEVSLEIYEWLLEMERDGLLKYTDNTDPIAPFLAMATETSSMLIDTSAAISTVDSAIEGTLDPDQVGLDDGTDLSGFSFPDLQLTVGGLPGLEAPGRGQMGGGTFYLVDGEDPAAVAAAWDFLKYFNAVEQQVTWAVEASMFPVRQAAVEDPALQADWTDTRRGRWVAAAYDSFAALDPAFPGPVIGPYREFREAVKNGVESVILGETTPADAVADVDAAFQDELDAYAADVGG